MISRTCRYSIVFLFFMLAFASNALGLVFTVDTKDEFRNFPAVMTGVVASDTSGADADYIRILNANPGMDGSSGTVFPRGGNLVWSKKRRITLQETVGASRFGEKAQFFIDMIGGARRDWGDLRLTDNANNSIPFRLLNFETPVDNPGTRVKLLFEANAAAASTTFYWLYYGNAEATSIATVPISPFYLYNHDFEKGLASWETTIGSIPNIITSDEENLSIVPEGFVGFESKACLSALFPESGGTAINETGGYFCRSQQIIGPCTGTYQMTAFRRTNTSGYDTSNNLRTIMVMRNNSGSSQVSYYIPAGITDWNISVLEFTTTATRTVVAGLGLGFYTDVAGWKERHANWDWVTLEPKTPLESSLGLETTAGYLTIATYVSRVFDSGVTNPAWGALSWVANTTAPGTTITFETETGDGVASNPWRTISENGQTIDASGGVSSRYLRFRALLKTTNTAFTPLLDRVDIFYALPATEFEVIAPATVTAGTQFDIRVTAKAGVATATGFTGQVILSSPSPTASFPQAVYSFIPSDDGTKILRGFQTVEGPFQIWASATVPGIASGVSSPTTCIGNETNSLTFSGVPGAVPAGGAFSSIQIRALDRFGNLNVSDGNTVSLSCSDPTPASIPASVVLVNGIATLSNIKLFRSPSQTLTALDSSRGLSASTTVNITPGAAAEYLLTPLPLPGQPDQYQNSTFTLRIQAVDAFKNIDSGYSNSFTMGVSHGMLSSSAGVISGGQLDKQIFLTATGNISLTATDSTPLVGNLSLSIHPTISPSLERFSVDAGAVQLAGVPFTLNIEARDVSDNILTTYQGACRITSSLGSPTPSLTTGYSFLDGVLSLPFSLSGASDTVTVRVEDIEAATVFGAVVLKVLPAGVDRFRVIASSSVIAGASASFSIEALDGMGNRVTNYTGTVFLTHDATTAETVLPTAYSFVPADKGRRTFSGAEAARFTKAEVVRIRAEDSGRVGLSNAIKVIPNAALPTVSILPLSTSVNLGERFSFDVTLRDSFGNQLASSTNTVLLGSAGVPLSGPGSYGFLSFEDGFHRFHETVIPLQLGTFSIIVTDQGSGASATTEAITVVSGETLNFALYPQVILATAGFPISFTIIASDSAGNINRQYRGSVRFLATDSRAYLPPDSTLTDGVGIFQGTFYTAGSYQVKALDTQNPSISGEMAVLVAATSPARLAIGISSETDFRVSARDPFTVDVQVTDLFGNPASFTGNVFLSTTDTNPFASPAVTLPFTNQAMRSILGFNFASAGVQIISASSTGLLKVDGPPIVVDADAPATITCRYPRSVSSEFFYPLTVIIKDDCGNPTPLYQSTITVTGGVTGGTFQARPTPQVLSAGDNGTFIFNCVWNIDTDPPTNTGSVSFNPTIIPRLNITGIQVDGPRSNAVLEIMSNLWVSNPDRQVVASEPFQVVVQARSARDRPAAPITEWIDFEISNGEVFPRSVQMVNQNSLPVTLQVTRSGYLTLAAKSRSEPNKTGTISFVAQPGPLHKVTITADSPQKAGNRFPWVAEWWDRNDNYAENAVGPLVHAASAPSGTGDTLPLNWLINGRGGKIEINDNQGYFDTRFWAFSSTTSLRNELMTNQISIAGIYDEDFTDGAIGPQWQTMTLSPNAGNVTNATYSLDEGLLKIICSGSHSIYQSTNNSINSNDDAYFYLYFPWPATDTQNFNARMHIRRFWYNQFDDTNNLENTNHSLVGILARHSNAGNRQPHLCAHMHNNTGKSINMDCNGWLTFRNVTTGNATKYRKTLPNQTMAAPPKWIRMRRTGANSYDGGWSADGNQFLDFTGGSGTNPNPTWPAPENNFNRLGICVSAGNTTANAWSGGGWISEFRVNRYSAGATFTSVIYDAGSSQVTYGTMTITAERPAGTALVIQARAAATEAAVAATGWTTLTNWTWSGESGTSNDLTAAGFTNRRFLQYRLTLVAATAGTAPDIVYVDTPIVKDVAIPFNVTETLGARFQQRGNVEVIASYSVATFAVVPVEIKGNTVSTLEITVPTPPVATAGIPFTVSVRALDAQGNIADDATGTWRFSTSDGGTFPGIMPSDYTLVPAVDRGQHTFYSSSILMNGPTQTITASVTGTMIGTTSIPITVNPGQIDRFLASATTPQTASVAFPLYIQARDLYDNLKVDYVGSITFLDTRTGGVSLYVPSTLPGVPASWSQGNATLTPGVRLSKAEKVQVKVYGDNRPGITNPIEIRGATAASLLLSVTTNQPTAGQAFGLTVTALDEFGNTAPSYNGTVAFTSTDIVAGVVLPAPYSFNPVIDQGSHSWPLSAVMITPGAVTLTVSDSVIPTLTRNYPLTVLPGEVARFELSCAPIQTASVPFNLLITAYDAYGHLKTNFSEKVFLNGSFSSILPHDVSGFSNGQLLVPSAMVSHSSLPKTGWLVASYGTAIGSISLTVGAPSSLFDHYALETVPATPTAGEAFKLVIKAVGATGTVYISLDPTTTVSLTASNSAGVQVTPPMTPISATGFTSGIKEVYAKIWEAGVNTIWVKDAISGRIGSLSLTVLPSNLAYFEVIPGTCPAEIHPNVNYQRVNVAFPLTITAFDTIGNVKTTYSEVVQLSENGTGSLSLGNASLVNGSTTVSIQYDFPGKIKITARDAILDKSGTSANLSFFGALASFALDCALNQTHNATFPMYLTAYDSFGQVKLNLLNASTTPTQISWVGGGPGCSFIPGVFNPLPWTDGKAVTVMRITNTDKTGTLVMRQRANSTPSASGTKLIQMHQTSSNPEDHLELDILSPQKSGVPFLLFVRAVDAAGAVVPTWAKPVELLATQTVYPGTIPAGYIVGGQYSTNTAMLCVPGFFRITASSTSSLGLPITGSQTLEVRPGPLGGISIQLPPFSSAKKYAPLNAPFQMSVAGLTSDGQIKTDWVPDGLVRLKLNATATGFLAIDTIDPADFIAGIGTIAAQIYNKSQLIWISAKDPETGLATVAGPFSVYGPPAKFYLDPQPTGKGTIADPIYWNNFFLARLTVKDANGFIVPSYDANVAFSVVPGTTLSIDPGAVMVPPTDNQWFSSTFEGVHDFVLKVNYATTTDPLPLRLVASDTVNNIFRTTGDFWFQRVEAFDHWEITEPLPGQKRQKKVKFSFKVRAVSNFGTPMNVTKSPTVVTSVLDSPVVLTGFNASPTGLIFTAESATTTQAIADYFEAATSTVRWTVDPFGIGVASVAVDLILEESRLRTELIKVVPSTRYILSMYIKTKDKALATGTGAIEVSCYAPSDPASYTHLATLNNPNGPSGIVVKTAGEHDWQRYSWWFETAADTASIAIRLSADVGVVYFDALMLEPATRPDQTTPTVYSPHPVGIIHTASDSSVDMSGNKYYWQW